MKRRTNSTLNSLVPIGSQVVILEMKAGKYAFSYKGMWFGYYSIKLFDKL